MNPKPSRVPLDTMHSTSPPPAPAAPPGPPLALTGEQVRELHEQVIAALKTCFDPEIPVNIHELGLIYDIDVQPTGMVNLRMTLTSPACPVAGSLPGEVQAKVRALPNVSEAKVDLVWDPPWEMSRMSEAARLTLGLD